MVSSFNSMYVFISNETEIHRSKPGIILDASSSRMENLADISEPPNEMEN